MKLYTETDQYKLYEGSMLDMLDVIPENSIGAIVTDPPYELNFMNKGWDRSGIAFQKETWEKCIRVLKPGGYLLCFGASRNSHRVACAIEDAGFEIRDTIMWLYGCLSEDTEVLTKDGFKLFRDITDEDVIHVYDVNTGWTRWEKPERWNVYHVENETCYRIKSDLTDQLVSKNHRCLIERDGKFIFEFAENLNSIENFPIIRDDSNIYFYALTSATVTEETYSGMLFCPTVSTGCFIARRNGQTFITGNSGFPKSMNIGKAVEAKLTTCSANTQEFKNLDGEKSESGSLGMNKRQFDQGCRSSNYDDNCEEYTTKVNYTTKEGKCWDGWGTALKPAFESITVARKPCEGSTTDNVLKYGVGGINIDECRIGADTIVTNGARNVPMRGDNRTGKALGMFQETDALNTEHIGRFPANVILTYDDSDFDEVCGGMPDTKPAGNKIGKEINKNLDYNASSYKLSNNKCPKIEGDNGGSAARYFYCAKASKLDRDEGLPEGTHNIHPTLKPVNLMRYLVRLVSPKGSTILDPFNGSGSTGKAVMFENRSRNANYKYIGIDLSEEYLQISKARIDYAMVADMTIDETGKVKLNKQDESAKTKLKQINLFEFN